MLAFSRRKNALLGLDISSTAVKLVELSRVPGSAPSGIRVAAYAIESLPPNTVVGQKITSYRGRRRSYNGETLVLGSVFEQTKSFDKR